MKRTGLIILSAIVAVCLASCTCNKKANPLKGVIYDATMNTVTVIDAAGDTVTFSTMDADRSEAHGLLLGDTAVVTYTGELGVEGSVPAATKVVVIRTPRDADKLVGSWVQPIAGQEGKVQGIKIGEDGQAESINMATLVYQGWYSFGANDINNADMIVLRGQSIGNKQTIDFTDTMRVVKLTADSLVLSEGAVVLEFVRQ